MIYVTGDTHGQIDFAKLRIFADNNPQLTKNDYVIIAGDFGAVWCEPTLEKDLKPYEELPFTVLWVDGNHENFTMVNSYPSWWREEMPSYEELDEGIANLKRYNNKIDYIITHSCGERALMYPPLRTRSSQMCRYPENNMLSYIEDITWRSEYEDIILRHRWCAQLT